jgi:hypothetical protein
VAAFGAVARVLQRCKTDYEKLIGNGSGVKFGHGCCAHLVQSVDYAYSLTPSLQLNHKALMHPPWYGTHFRQENEILAALNRRPPNVWLD